MPIDFDALPERTEIPDEQQAIAPWLIALFVIMVVGAALSIATWPADRPTHAPWFWIRSFGLPFLTWLFAYSGW